MVRLTYYGSLAFAIMTGVEILKKCVADPRTVIQRKVKQATHVVNHHDYKKVQFQQKNMLV